MREIPHFTEGTLVDIEVTEFGFTVIKSEKKHSFPFTEAELLKDLSAHTGHADLLALPVSKELQQ